MNGLLIGLLGALVSTNQPVAISNFVAQTTGVSVNVPDPNDPVEKEYQKLMEDDDAAQEEVDKWIRDNDAFREQGAGLPGATLRARVLQRLKPVRDSYEDFLRRQPKHARARLAFGSFLMDTGDEVEGGRQMEMARETDPTNPAAWNNLANHYAHRSPVKKAFEYYARAIELSPNEPVYYQNFATTVFLFRKDAMEFYGIDEQQVFDRSLALYRKAVALAPKDFVLISDYAQSYYGIKPFRASEALAAWESALDAAADDVQREGAHLHLARVHVLAGQLDEAQKHLDLVKHDNYSELKRRVKKNLEAKKAGDADPATIPKGEASGPDDAVRKP